MAENSIKISIGMPLGIGIKSDAFTSFIQMMLNTPIQLHFNFYSSPYIHESRNQIVQEAKRANCTHLMFIDTDLQYPGDGILKLLKHNKSIVAGSYKMKTREGKGTIKIIENGEYKTIDNPPGILFKCDVAPTGFMLIDMKVFDVIRFPWFMPDYDGKDMVTEDVYFCRKAKDKSIDIWCDGTINIGHVGEYIY